MAQTDPAKANAAPSTAPPTSMRRAARSGARLGLLSGLAQQLLSIAATVVLVRILSPREVGLAAVAALVVGFASLFTGGGFGQILVKRATIDERVTSTIFWTATGTGALVSAAISVLAVPLARLAGQPQASALVLILAPTVLVASMASVPRGLLQRRLQFGRMYAADLSAMVVYVAVQIVLALDGAGAKSIVVGQLASAVVSFGISAALAAWRPRLAFDASVARAEARFSGGTLANTLTTYLIKNADNWAVSRSYSAGLLGIYYVAYVLPNILRQRLTWMATDILMPIFARLVGDQPRSRRAYRDALGIHAFIGFPIMAGIAALAPRIVAVFFGSRWAAAAPPLRLLALAAMVEFVTQAATTVFIARGVPGRNAVIKLYSLAVLLAGLTIFHRHGLVAVAACVLAASTTGAVVSQAMVGRLLRFGIRDTAAALLPVAAATATMTAGVVLLDRAISGWPAALALFVLVPVGAALYLLTVRLIAPTASRALLRETLAIALPRRHAKARS